MTHAVRDGRAAVATSRRAARPEAQAPRRARVTAAQTLAHAAPQRSGPQRLLPAAAAVLVLALALVASACGGSSSGAASRPRELNVFAASSLTDAFTRIAAKFTATHPDVKVVCDFGGSNDLATQIRQGAPADVFASADTTDMNKVAAFVGAPRPFARNKLCIAVAPGDPKGITGLADLARKDITVILAAPEVPAGSYAEEILSRAGVTVHPVSLEVSVKGVVTKIALGEADAGIVYVTDVSAAKGEVQGVAIPNDQNLDAVYPIATVDAGRLPDDARAFVDFVLSAEGQKVLRSDGFMPPQ